VKKAFDKMPPQAIKGAAVKKNKKKGMGSNMGGLFGSVTAKKPELDNKVRKQHAMRTARLTGKIL
jgi:hypothetical protein